MLTVAAVIVAFLLGLLVALVWPGNPASRAVVSVTTALSSTLQGAGR